MQKPTAMGLLRVNFCLRNALSDLFFISGNLEIDIFISGIFGRLEMTFTALMLAQIPRAVAEAPQCASISAVNVISGRPDCGANRAMKCRGPK